MKAWAFAPLLTGCLLAAHPEPQTAPADTCRPPACYPNPRPPKPSGADFRPRPGDTFSTMEFKAKIRGASDLKLYRWMVSAQFALSLHDHQEALYDGAREWVRERRRKERAEMAERVKLLEEEEARRAARQFPPGT